MACFTLHFWRDVDAEAFPEDKDSQGWQTVEYVKVDTEQVVAAHPEGGPSHHEHGEGQHLQELSPVGGCLSTNR